MTYSADDILPEEPIGEVVHWMDPGPLRVGRRDVPVTAIAAFAAGIVAGVGAILLYRYLEPRYEVLPPWRRRHGLMH